VSALEPIGPAIVSRLSDGLMTLTNPAVGTRVTIPWPPPRPKDDAGAWAPFVLEVFPDGSALALWQWHAKRAEERADGDVVDEGADRAAE